MSNILKYQNPSSPLLNPHKIIENVPAREWGPRKINEDYSITEGKGTNFWRAPFQYWGNKGLGSQNEKLARDLVSEFDQMKSENPDYNYTLDKNYQSYDDAINYINHLEGLKKYLHLPYDTGLLMESKYKPTRLQSTNEKTYKFRSSMTPGYWNDVVEDMVMGEHNKNQYYDQSLNEFTAYRDRDEKGDFVSIYDEWDYNPAVRGGNKKLNKVIDSVTGGKPFVIYDRVYLDDYYDIPEEARGNPFITPAVVTAYKKGGRIHIKKKNRGSFTRWCKGKVTEECIRRGKNSSNPAIRKKAVFAANSRRWKHENGGILKAQEGTGNGFWSKLWNAVKAGGMAARDAKLGAVGAQQVRDLYSEGKNQEAQDLAKQYAKANTTGIALAGGAASTGLLGDLMVTGATTAADTFIDGDTDHFGKNLAKNVTGDLIGRKIEKYIKPVGDLFESSMFKLFEDPGTIYITNGKSGILKTNPSKYTQRLLNGGSKRTDVSKDFAKKINELEPTVLIRFDETGKRLPIQDFRFWRKRPDFIYPEVPNGTISIPDNNTTLMESIGDVYDINTGKLTSKTNYIRDLNRKLTDEEFSILTDHEIAHLIDRTSNRNLGDVDFISGNYISDPSEIHARISQAKSAANITDGSKKFTGEGYRKMFWDYITSGKVDNQMSKFYVNVKDWNKLANWANKFVPGIGTTVVINQQSK